jgi:hypothetical protein
VSNIEDVFDEIEEQGEQPEAPWSEATKGDVSAIDLVDSISRAAYRRRIDHNRSWQRHLSSSAEPKH